MCIKIGIIDSNLIQKREIMLYLQNNLDFDFEIITTEEENIFNRKNKIDILLIEYESFYQVGFTKLKHISNIAFGLIIYSPNPTITNSSCTECKFYNFFKPYNKFELIHKLNEKALSLMEKTMIFDKHNQFKLTLKFAKELHYIDIKEIKFLKAEGNYTQIYLSNTKVETVSKTLKSFESLLIHKNFFRPHQSYIVNLDYVERYLYEGTLILNESEKIPVAKKGKEIIRKIFSLDTN